MDGLDGRNDVVADQQGESDGRHGGRQTKLGSRHNLSPTTMSEVVNVLVAFAVIVFIFRWATSG